jgi:hypothetical protein
MLDVYIFTDKPHRYAFTKDKTGANLPKENYGEWQLIENRTYILNDLKFPLLTITSNELNNEIEANSFHILDLKLFDQ